MTLTELKEPFERLYNNKLDKYNYTEIAELYLSSSSNREKNEYISYLICNFWNLVQKIYKINSNILTSEECYDIFIQTLQYVLSTHPWTKMENTLFNDDKAFDKAMAVTIQSRRKNYLKAKFTQKRIANNNNFSLDKLDEDFQDGYFYYSYNEDFSESCIPLIEERIKFFFSRKNYLASYILEAIIFNNVYNENNNFDIRKLRKYLRNIDITFCKYFSKKYELDLKEIINSLKYFQNITQDKLDAKIYYAFNLLKNDSIIKNILDN